MKKNMTDKMRQALGSCGREQAVRHGAYDETERNCSKSLITEKSIQRAEENVIQMAKLQLQKTYRNKNSFKDLLLCQIKFCGFKMWAFELLTAVAAGMLLRWTMTDKYFLTTRKLMFFAACFVVFVPMMLLPFLYRSIRYQMFEVESTSVFSIKTVLFSKFLLFFGGEIGLISAVIICLRFTTMITFVEILGMVLIPFLLANDGFLFLLKKMKSEKLCQSFLYYGIALFAVIVALFLSKWQIQWTMTAPVTVTAISLLAIYGIYESIEVVQRQELA